MTDQKISYEDIAYSNMMSIEAIVSLLTRKGLITQQEILDEREGYLSISSFPIINR
jgi:hypothetical protein